MILIDLKLKWTAWPEPIFERWLSPPGSSRDMGLLARFGEGAAVIFVTLETVGGVLDR
jgi:hypothetical protein